LPPLPRGGPCDGFSVAQITVAVKETAVRMGALNSALQVRASPQGASGFYIPVAISRVNFPGAVRFLVGIKHTGTAKSAFDAEILLATVNRKTISDFAIGAAAVRDLLAVVLLCRGSEVLVHPGAVLGMDDPEVGRNYGSGGKERKSLDDVDHFER
jgi:hypothetical protein